MNPRIAGPSQKTEPGLHHGTIEVAGISFRFYKQRRRPQPLWQQACAQARDFRGDELERTHWKKVWRLMFGD